MSPKTNPVKPRKPSPQRLSSQRPAKPGKTITAATAMIRDTQVMASETGEGSFEEEFTCDSSAVKSFCRFPPISLLGNRLGGRSACLPDPPKQLPTGYPFRAQIP